MIYFNAEQNHNLNTEDKIMTISMNATTAEILEAEEFCKLFGLELEFVLDEF